MSNNVSSQIIENVRYVVALGIPGELAISISEDISFVSSEIEILVNRERVNIEKAAFFRNALHGSSVSVDVTLLNDLSASSVVLSKSSSASNAIDTMLSNFESIMGGDASKFNGYHKAKSMAADIRTSLSPSVKRVKQGEDDVKGIQNSASFHSQLMRRKSAEISSLTSLSSLLNKYAEDIIWGGYIVDVLDTKGIDTITFAVKMSPEERMAIVNE